LARGSWLYHINSKLEVVDSRQFGFRVTPSQA
jgi:hypothetical protein